MRRAAPNFSRSSCPTVNSPRVRPMSVLRASPTCVLCAPAPFMQKSEQFRDESLVIMNEIGRQQTEPQRGWRRWPVPFTDCPLGVRVTASP